MQRSNVLFCVPFCFAAAIAFAQAPGQTQPPPSLEKPASLSGEVRDSMSGLPIQRAHVVLRIYQNNGVDRFGTLTDAGGKFSILGVPPGTYSIAMDRTGYVAPATLSTTNVVLAADQQKDNYKLKLIPVGAILGKVVDGEGVPMEGMSVQAIQGGRAIQSSATDDRGQYRIGGLAPGKYRVKAVVPALPLPPEIRTDGTAESHYATTFYPGGLDAKAAKRVEVGAATDVSGIDIRLLPVPIVRISGRVSGMPEGAKPGSVQVRQGQNYMNGAQYKPDGTFEIWRLDPGKYSVQANNNSTGETMNSAWVEIELGQSDLDNLDLHLLPAEDIHGQVVFDDEMAKRPQASQNPAQGQGQSQGQPTNQSTTRAQQQTQQQQQPTRLSLRDADRGFVMKQETVADDGSFTLSKIQPGKYVVMAQGYPAYVKSVRIGKIDSGGPELDLSNGSGGAQVTVTLASTFGTLSGTVSDDKGPAAGARILLRDAQNRGFQRMGRGLKDGTFKMATLPPGKYWLAVLDDNDNPSVLLTDPLFEDFDESFEIGPNETVSRDLKLKAVKN